MGSPCSHDGAARRHGRVPLTPGAALVRERLAERRRELAEECPATVDGAAAVLHALHERLWGGAAELAADRSPRYRRKQLSGERALPLADMVYLVLHDPEGCRPALDALAWLAGLTLTEAPRVGERSFAVTHAQAMAGLADLEQGLAEALEDGVLSWSERVDLAQRLGSLLDRFEQMRSALLEGGS